MVKVEPVCFPGGRAVVCERKGEARNDSKIFGLREWKGRSKCENWDIAEKDQKLGLKQVKSERP